MTSNTNKRAFAGTLSAIALLTCGTAFADLDFGDIGSWVGSGANESALVVDWNDGSGFANDFKIWGYRWDTVDAPTAEDMIRDVAAADADLYFLFFDFGSFGQSIEGVGYDADHDGFSLSPAVVFTAGIGVAADSSTNETSNDAEDLWNPGYNAVSGQYWNYYTSSVDLLDPETDWVSSGTGISGTNLSDGDWNGLGYASFGASLPAAVPEPTPLALLIFGLCFAAAHRRFVK